MAILSYNQSSTKEIARQCENDSYQSHTCFITRKQLLKRRWGPVPRGGNAQEVEIKCIFGITRFPVQTEGKEFKGRKQKVNTTDATKGPRNQRSLDDETYNKFCTANFLRTNQRQDRHLVVYGYKNKVYPQTYTHNYTGISLVKGSSQLSMYLYVQ